MRQSQRDKRNYIIGGLLTLVLFMTVGFAAFRTTLTINGTASISSNWCVGFDNTKTNTYEITKGTASGTNPSATMTYDGTACSSTYVPIANLGANFYQPGDKVEYTLTIANKSSLGAAIESITVDGTSVTSNQTITKGNIIWKVYMPESTTLAATTGTTTMVVSAEFQNDTDLSNYTLNESQTIAVGINAEQDDGEGGMDITPATFTGTIYRWNTNNVAIGAKLAGEVWCDIETSSGTNYGCFNTESECETAIEQYADTDTCEQQTLLGEYTTDASTLNKTYYLKHDVEEDIITNSYVCFVYNNAEHCMKGGDGGASFAANTQTIKDFQTYYASQNPSCNFISNNSNCNGGGFYFVGASSDGNVDVSGSSSEYCYVSDDGDSDCGQ